MVANFFYLFWGIENQDACPDACVLRPVIGASVQSKELGRRRDSVIAECYPVTVTVTVLVSGITSGQSIAGHRLWFSKDRRLLIIFNSSLVVELYVMVQLSRA
jgi:hypothetical protein